MPTLYTWKRKRSEGDELNLVDQRAQAGDAVTLFEENGSVYKTKSAVLDRPDHDSAYVEIDAGDEKEIIGWTCNRAA